MSSTRKRSSRSSARQGDTTTVTGSSSGWGERSPARRWSRLRRRWPRMRHIWKILGIVLVAVVVLLVLAISATIGWRPFIGPKARPLTDRRFESKPARLERGQYLVENLVGCLDCHSERDRAQHE